VVNWVCPHCGGPVVVLTIYTYPETTCYRCQMCSYHFDSTPNLHVVTAVAPVEAPDPPQEKP